MKTTIALNSRTLATFLNSVVFIHTIGAPEVCLDFDMITRLAAKYDGDLGITNDEAKELVQFAARHETANRYGGAQ